MAIRQKEDFFEKLLNKFLPKFLKALNIDWEIGSAFAITNIRRSGKKTTMSPLSLSKKDQEANIKIIAELVKGINIDMSRKINRLVNNNISARGSDKDLTKQLKGLFDKESPNYFNYKNRMKTVAFNETNRIENNSSFLIGKRLKFSHKYLGQGRKNPWPDSLIALGKYGSEEKAIPINENFEITYNNKTQIYMFPPGRVNDSEMIYFTNKEDKENA